jgi:hypothetical protein
MYALICIAIALAILYFAAGLASLFLVSVREMVILRWLLTGSLVTSVLIGLSAVPKLLLGYLITPKPNHALRRLLLLDSVSESSSTRGLFGFIEMSLSIVILAWFLGLARYAVVLLLCPLCMLLRHLFERITPPLVLYLGSSNPFDARRAASLTSIILREARVVNIMRPTEHEIAPADLQIDSYRTSEGSWVDMLHELLALSRIVVIDLRLATEAVLLEFNVILTTGTSHKTIALLSQEQIVEYGDLVVELKQQHGVCVTKFDDLISLLRIFAHPAMHRPTLNEPIDTLVEGVMATNPHVKWALPP